MTFFPNSKGIQFFLSEMIFRIHPTLTSAQGDCPRVLILNAARPLYIGVVSACHPFFEKFSRACAKIAKTKLKRGLSDSFFDKYQK